MYRIKADGYISTCMVRRRPIIYRRLLSLATLVEIGDSYISSWHNDLILLIIHLNMLLVISRK